MLKIVNSDNRQANCFSDRNSGQIPMCELNQREKLKKCLEDDDDKEGERDHLLKINWIG